MKGLVCMQVRDALCKKVSRERVGAELEGMFNGALALLPCLPVGWGCWPCQASNVPRLAHRKLVVHARPCLSSSKPQMPTY